MKKYLLSTLSVLVLPLVVGAQQISSIETALTTVSGWLDALLPILIGVAVLYFIWSLLQFLRDSGSKKDEARSHMIWGIVILFVMVSIWGLVDLIQGTVTVSNTPISAGAPDVNTLVPN